MKNWFIENKWKILLSMLATFLPTVIGLILWDQLPDSMITHFGADGVPDGTSAKAFAVFGLPAIMAALNLAALVISALDPRGRKQSGKVNGMMFWIMPVLSTMVLGVMYAVALGKPVNGARIVPVVLGVLFVVLGNYMPKTTQNKTMGIKIIWTLLNEENWNKTHRLAGKLWVICGVLLMPAGLLPLPWMGAVLAAVVALAVLVPYGYSYSIYRKHKAAGIAYNIPPATKENKIVRLLVMVLILSLLIAGYVIMFTGDITCTCGEEALVVENSFINGLALPYEEIDVIRFRDEFDKGLRNMGFGSIRLSMGVFESEELPVYTLYAYNSCDAVVLIRSGEKYLALNAETEEETLALYEALLEKLGE